jgi:hypothetical protein
MTEVGDADIISPDYVVDLRDGNLIKEIREEYMMLT